MANHVRHFAINADDVDRARRFYAGVFDWTFTPWGPPGFFLIRTGPDHDRGLQGALQERRTPLSDGGMRGYECTIGVDDLDGVLARVATHGGEVTAAPFDIDGVGRLAFIDDGEGNRVGVMQYDPAYPL